MKEEPSVCADGIVDEDRPVGWEDVGPGQHIRERNGVGREEAHGR